MPRMPELRGKQFPDFVPVDVNTDTIPFRDKIREKQRQKLLEQRKEKTDHEGRRRFVKNKAWSKQKAKREKKKMNKKRKREEVTWEALLLTHPPWNSWGEGWGGVF